MKWHTPPFVLRELKLEVTHECPLVCQHCSSEAEPSSKRQMSRGHALRIANEAVAMGVGQIDITGGEPLVWPHLSDLVELLRGPNVSVSVYTSGNVAGFRDHVVMLHDMGVQRTIFSLYAASADLHDYVTRVPGSFDKTLEAVAVAQDAGMATQLHFVPMSCNFEQLLPIAQLAYDRQIDKVSALRFVPQGRGSYMADSELSRSQNLDLRKAINESRKQLAVRTGSPYNFLLVNKEPECCAGIDRMSIGPEYDIYPCDAFKQIKAVEVTGTEQYSKADAFSLQDCWDNSLYLKKVRSYLTTQFPDKCVDCNVLSQCLSGCLAQKVLKNGTFEKDIDPMCLMR